MFDKHIETIKINCIIDQYNFFDNEERDLKICSLQSIHSSTHLNTLFSIINYNSTLKINLRQFVILVYLADILDEIPQNMSISQELNKICDDISYYLEINDHYSGKISPNSCNEFFNSIQKSSKKGIIDHNNSKFQKSAKISSESIDFDQLLVEKPEEIIPLEQENGDNELNKQFDNEFKNNDVGKLNENQIDQIDDTINQIDDTINQIDDTIIQIDDTIIQIDDTIIQKQMEGNPQNENGDEKNIQKQYDEETKNQNQHFEDEDNIQNLNQNEVIQQKSNDESMHNQNDDDIQNQNQNFEQRQNHKLDNKEIQNSKNNDEINQLNYDYEQIQTQNYVMIDSLNGTPVSTINLFNDSIKNQIYGDFIDEKEL